MSRVLMVSSDCHAVARIDDYRPYLESRYRDAFDGWHAEFEAQRALLPEDAFFHADTVSRFREHEKVLGGGEDGYWDFERRIRELEADGVAAEVIFPNPGVPFNAFPMTGFEPDRELVFAGAKVYNRWLADRVSAHPGRHVGIALVTIDDIAKTVAEVETARRGGLRGILLPTGMGACPSYNDERYEPLWAACADLGVIVHIHTFPACNPATGPGAAAITTIESIFHLQRPLVCMMLGGVFHRHPTLRFVVTEAGIDWIPGLLDQLDTAWTGHPTQEFTKHLRLTPQMQGLTPCEIWSRQCWAGASFMPRAETEVRHDVGIDRVMWGSDYPHVEGTWPHTPKFLNDAFEGVPEDEVRQMVGGNAIDCYGLDRSELSSVAERIGPEPAAFSH